MKEALLYTGNSLDISKLAALKTVWMEEIDGAGAIVVEAEPLTRADTAGIQFLLATRLEAKLRGQSFRIANPSHALLEAASALGLKTAILEPV